MYKNVEIRKLPADALCNIVNILEIDNDWKRFMSFIPKDLNSPEFHAKYNNEHIRLIEKHAEETHKKCTEILFDEWGTSGRTRPTLNIIKDIVNKAQMIRAADEIAKILQEAPPRRPDKGPGAPISLNLTEMLLNSDETLNSVDSIDHKLCNGPTKQMKSESNMIIFSESVINPSSISIKTPISNGISTQINSDSDFIKFPKTRTAISMNVPDITGMMGKTQGVSTQDTDRDTDLETDRNESSCVTNESHSDNFQYPNVYQTSFPNIDVSLGIESAILQDENLIHFNYDELHALTNNFSETPSAGPHGISGRIGSGGFGDVFVGAHPNYGLLAVKKAHNNLFLHRKPDIAMEVFNTEVKNLSQFRHKNIVPILGFSKDGPAPCIVCKYIDGGSLLNNIAAKILSEKQRIDIMVGTAEGLKYLHTSNKPMQTSEASSVVFEENESQNPAKNFVHRDVKSANILLTLDCVPKLCDFGLVKQYDATIITSSPMGTSAYMAPEGLSGTITQKIDIYSFGIVLLELLTGLKPIVVKNGDKINIKLYVEENSTNNDISNLLDPVVSGWIKDKEIYSLAQWCLKYERSDRPDIVKVCDYMYKIRDE